MKCAMCGRGFHNYDIILVVDDKLFCKDCVINSHKFGTDIKNLYIAEGGNDD